MPAKIRKQASAAPAKKAAKRTVNFVTGASGKLGRALVTRMLQRGDEVRVLIRSNDELALLPPGVVAYVGHVNDRNILESACSGADNVYHLAAIVSERGYTDEILKVNVEGTKNVLDAAAKAKVRRFFYASTVDVYGVKRKEALSESARLEPQDKYGYSKMLAEKEIVEHSPKVPYTIFRFSTIYGPGFEHSFFKVFKAMETGRIFIVGRGTNKLTTQHLDDVIEAFMLAEDNELAKNQVFNISDGQLYTQEYLLGIVAELLKVPKPTTHLNEFLLKVIAKRRGMNTDELRYLVSNRQIDISKAQAMLKYRPKVDIRSGLEGLIGEYKSTHN